MPPASKATGEEPKQRRRPGRVPVSCAECRRLKLRCDRNIPCQSCTKRGCAAICPDGSLPTSRGNRNATAEAELLQKQVDELRARESALEDALRSLQAVVSDTPHPLLRSLSTTASPQLPGNVTLGESSNQGSASASGTASLSPGPSEGEEDVLELFGNLTLGPRGSARFFGSTARPEFLIHAPENRNKPEDVAYPRLSGAMVYHANIDFDTRIAEPAIWPAVVDLMPQMSQVIAMCETFTHFGRFLWYGMPRSLLFDELVSACYDIAKNRPTVTTSHNLSLLFIVFALATLFHPDKPPNSLEAQEWYLLSRLALRFAPPSQDTTVVAVQTLIYMALYLELSDCEAAHSASAKAWMLMGRAVNLGHSIGLHMHGTRWRLDEDASCRRSEVFWQLFACDTWLSFGLGRPPNVTASLTDCEPPEARESPQDDAAADYYRWLWRFTELLNSNLVTAFGPKPPAYTEILELDRCVRDLQVPLALTITFDDPLLHTGSGVIMMATLACMHKEAVLLYLHRPYFSEALAEGRYELLAHKYAPSVVAILRSAWRLIEAADYAYKHEPMITSRINFIWSYALVGGIIMSLCIIKAATSPLAALAQPQLAKLARIFESAAATSQIVSNNLPIVRKLQNQARDAMTWRTADPVAPRFEPDWLSDKLQAFIRPDHVGVDAVALNIPRRGAQASPEAMFDFQAVHPTIAAILEAFDSDVSEQSPMPLDDVLQMPYPEVQMTTSVNQRMDRYSPRTPSPDPLHDVTVLQYTPTLNDRYPQKQGVEALDASWQILVEQLGY